MAEKDLTKTCSQCQVEKPLSEFYKDKTSQHGIRSQCKRCYSSRIREYYNKNKEAIHARDRLSYKKNYNKHKKNISKKRKIYYNKNRERLNAERCKYSKTQKGKEVSAKSSQKRQAAKAGAKIEDFSPQKIFNRDGYICQLCGCKTRPDYKNPYHPKYPNLDHIIPLSKGGDHSKINTQCLCRQCNIEKHNKTNFGDQLRMFD